MRKRGIIRSFNYAIEGFIHVVKTQRNMRIHFLIAVFALLLGIYLNFNRFEMLLLCSAITFVFLSEMINTAIEYVVDLVLEDRYHALAQNIKDITAGAVLVASLNAIIVGYLLFSRNIPISFETGFMKLRQSSWHLTFIALISVLALVVIVKTIVHRGEPLRGGMPSGHTALVFAIWMIIALLANNGLIIILSFILVFLVARSRLLQAIHSLWEVVAGAIVGMLATLLIFQLLR